MSGDLLTVGITINFYSKSPKFKSEHVQMSLIKNLRTAGQVEPQTYRWRKTSWENLPASLATCATILKSSLKLQSASEHFWPPKNTKNHLASLYAKLYFFKLKVMHNVFFISLITKENNLLRFSHFLIKLHMYT